MFAVSAFYKNITNYIHQGEVTKRLVNPMSITNPQQYKQTLVGFHGCRADGTCIFNLQTFVGGGKAHVKGVAFAYQTTFKHGFGLVANYTYAQGSTQAGISLPYLSKHSVTLSPYFENGPFAAKINITGRSKYLGVGYVAGVAPNTVDGQVFVGGSVSWQFNKHWQLQLTGQNLTNTRYYTYSIGDAGQELPHDKYTNGRRLSLQLHLKF